MNNLLDLLNEIESPGTFATGGNISPILPGLVINNIGEISFPLSPIQAEQIREQCEQAPFGLKEKTLVDLNVRNAWQLSPSEFQLLNPDWLKTLNKLCKQFNSFLSDPEIPSLTIEKTKKSNLLHVKEAFTSKNLDVQLEIILEKSKFTGIFTKNDASYRAVLQLFDVAQNQKQQIENLTRLPT
jgi:hypothetical protein